MIRRFNYTGRQRLLHALGNQVRGLLGDLQQGTQAPQGLDLGLDDLAVFDQVAQVVARLRVFH